MNVYVEFLKNIEVHKREKRNVKKQTKILTMTAQQAAQQLQNQINTICLVARDISLVYLFLNDAVVGFNPLNVGSLLRIEH